LVSDRSPLRRALISLESIEHLNPSGDFCHGRTPHDNRVRSNLEPLASLLAQYMPKQLDSVLNDCGVGDYALQDAVRPLKYIVRR
jgi:hypothetical protein